MDTVELMAQFVVLWNAAQQIQLTYLKKKIQLTETPDQIFLEVNG